MIAVLAVIVRSEAPPISGPVSVPPGWSEPLLPLPQCWDFGELDAGETKSREFILHNPGDEPVDISHVVPSCVCTKVWLAQRCIAPRDSIVARVTYRASPPVGARHASIHLLLVGGEKLSVPVRARTAIPDGPVPHLEPEVWDFGLMPVQGTVSRASRFRISNRGGAPFRLCSIQAPDGVTVRATLPDSISPAQSREFGVELFGPASKLRGQSLRFVTEDGTSVALRLRGLTTSPPAPWPRVIERLANGSVRICNAGSSPLKILRISWTSAGLGDELRGPWLIPIGAIQEIGPLSGEPSSIRILTGAGTEAVTRIPSTRPTAVLLGSGGDGLRPELALGEIRAGARAKVAVLNNSAERIRVAGVRIDPILKRIEAPLLEDIWIDPGERANVELRVTARAAPGTLAIPGVVRVDSRGRSINLPFAVRALVRSRGLQETLDGKAFRLQVLAIGEQLGRVNPCRCEDDQLGGGPRTLGATMELERKTRSTALVQLGDFVGDDSRLAGRKLALVLSTLAHAPRSIVVPGRQELAMGAATLRAAAAQWGVPVLACNLVDAGTGRRALPAHHIHRIGNKRVAFVGVTDPAVAGSLSLVSHGLSVTPGDVEVAREIELLRSRCDAVVVVSHGRFVLREALQAGTVPVCAVIVGRGTGHWAEGERRNGTAVLEVSGNGKLLASADLAIEDGICAAAVFESVHLDRSTPDDPRAVEALRRYKLKLRDLPPQPRISRSGEVYAGRDACVTCHTAAHDVWARSHHAHALASLKERGDQYDPDCLKCHTVGYDVANGYRTGDRNSQFADVQCESCHGPSSEHVRDPLANLPGLPDARHCTTCHDPENSPHFQFDKYWARIKHGR